MFAGKRPNRLKLFPSGEFPEDFKTMDLDLCNVAICGEQHLKRREIWTVWRSQYTTLYARLQNFIARKYVRSIAKPGMLMTDICETLEDTVRKLISENGLKAVPMFICDGFLTSRVAAHWTPNSGDNTVLQYDDVMKVDFGTHIDGMNVNFSFVSPLYKSQT
ncbi:unnamed protein product [Brassica oleracea]